MKPCKAGIGILAAAGIDGEVATVSPRNPQAFVITVPTRMTQERTAHIRKCWNDIFAGTPMADVSVIVLQEGMTLSVVDQVEE